MTEEIPVQLKIFENLYLDNRLVKAINKLGWKHPTQLQTAMIPRILQNKNILVRARKGNGKTSGYLLPILHNILLERKTVKKSPKPKIKGSGPFAIIVVPMKELAYPIYKLLLKILAQFPFIKTINIDDMAPDDDFACSDIVVASTERLLNILEENSVLLKSIKSLVLEESDLFYRFGQEKALRTIKSALPDKYQSIFNTSSLTEDLTSVKELFVTSSLVSLILKEILLTTSIEERCSETNIMALLNTVAKDDLKLFKEQRLKTFETWRMDHEEGVACTSERLAEAGFYSTATSSVPDSAKCAFCSTELIFEKEDDPITEHIEHSKDEGCPFISLNKPEKEWSLNDIMEIFIGVEAKTPKKRRLEFEFDTPENQEDTPSRAKHKKVSFANTDEL